MTLPVRKQKAAFLSLFALYTVFSADWISAVTDTVPKGFWNHFPWLASQLQRATTHHRLSYLTSGCGAIWTLVSPEAKQNSMSIENLYHHTKKAYVRDLAEVLSEYDVLVVCKDERNLVAEEKQKILWTFLRTSSYLDQEFRAYQLSKADTTVFVKKPVLNARLPEGMMPYLGRLPAGRP
jgi:hypothetical protein